MTHHLLIGAAHYAIPVEEEEDRVDFNIVKIAISVAIAVGGWIIGHYFNSRRDAEVNRKKMVTEYLVNAYRKMNVFASVLASGAKGNQSLADDINSAVGDVQLFGNMKQIQLVKEIAEYIQKNKCVDTDKLSELLHDLRNALRTELVLNAIESPIAHLYMQFWKD